MRLIDADAVLSKIGEYANHPSEELVNHLAIAFDILCDAPTIEIVRCKDCKHWSEKACHKFLATHPSDADDFCSYGERKSDE